MPKLPVSPPYTIDEAVSDEKEFWRHIRDLIGDAVEAATAEPTLAMRTVAANQKAIVASFAGMSTQLAVTNAGVGRIENLLMSMMLIDSELRDRLDRVLLLHEPKDSRPTPPRENGNGSHE